VLLVNAPEKLFEVYQDTMLIKHVPIKGLHGEVLPFDRSLTLIKEARSLGATTSDDERAFLPSASLVGLSWACNRAISPRSTACMVVENHRVFVFLHSTLEILVIPIYNQEESSQRPHGVMRAGFCFPFADTVCLLGYEVR
jgi:hypothetical protein